MTKALDGQKHDGGTVVLLHAHPDDESIFTGGTAAHLAAAGCRVVLLVATSGDSGETGGRSRGELAREREIETAAAAAFLGITHVEFLRYGDSGMDNALLSPTAFAALDLEPLALHVAERCVHWHADALVVYDESGIYPHPDHLQAHRVGARAAQIAAVPTLYQATVDHEYLHFVETHLIEQAAAALPVPTSVGVPTVLVDTTVGVGSFLQAKRAAMGAHASQIPADAPVLALNDADFEAIYGFEWYLRSGPPSWIEQLHACR